MKKLSTTLLTTFLFLFISTTTTSAQPLQQMSLIGAWGKEDNNLKYVLIFTEDVFSLSSYNIVEKKFNFSVGGKYSQSRTTITLQYEWNSKDSTQAGVAQKVALVLKKGKLQIENLADGLEKLEENDKGELSGSWIISGSYVNNVVSKRANPFYPRRTMKVLSGNYFHWISYNVVTNKFFDAGGGTYTSDNGKYAETIEYFTKTTASIGKKLDFEFSIENGDWRHKGQKSTGGPLDECWTKRKLIEEKFIKK